MNYWIISDTHFNHTKLEEWGCRSGDWQEQILRGLQQIPLHDTLIHLGDVCIGNDVEVHEKLFGISNGNWEVIYRNGVLAHKKNILVLGNHDKKSKQWYLTHGWDFVCDGIEMIYMGRYLHLTHRPARPQGNNTFNIHGHTHGNLHRSEEYTEFYNPKYHLDISPEIVGYKPLRLDTFIKNYK